MTKTHAFAATLALMGLCACEGTVSSYTVDTPAGDGASAVQGDPNRVPENPGLGPGPDSTDGRPGSASRPSAGSPSGVDAEPTGIGSEVFSLCDGGEESPAPRLLRLLTRAEYQQTVQDLLYLNSQEELDFAQLPLEARVLGYDNNARSQAVTSRHIDAYLDIGSALAQRAWERSRGQLVRCDVQQASCHEQFVREFGQRAFRRPLEGEEVDRYLQLFAGAKGDDASAAGVQAVVSAMLISPHFLYRSEVGEALGDGTFRLTPYEVASALSYQYWGTMPDDELFRSAESGQLDTAEQREAQARRLLESPRAQEQLYQFSLQWLGTYRVQDAFKDNEHFPQFSDAVRQAMLEEQRRLFVEVVLRDEGSLSDLYAPGFTFVNQPLADYYGLRADGQDFSRVPVSDGIRGGILGLGAVHTAHAHSNESSPIKRGVFVRRQLLCQALPPPPANLDTTPPGLDPTLTTRERFAVHTQSTACSGCHQYIDDLGFGLEGFDGAGKFRDEEYGLPIDTTGELLGLNSLAQSDRHPFDGPQELSELITGSEAGPACLALQYYRFARGYEEREMDACSLQVLQDRFEGSGQNVKELFVALAGLRSFVSRSED